MVNLPFLCGYLNNLKIVIGFPPKCINKITENWNNLHLSHFSLTKPKFAKPKKQKIIGLRQKQLEIDLLPAFSGVVYDMTYRFLPSCLLVNPFRFLLSFRKKKKKKVQDVL